MKKYKIPVITVREGIWYRIHDEDRITCCDCRLVHRVNFKALKYPKEKLRLYIKFFRDDITTNLKRKRGRNETC